MDEVKHTGYIMKQESPQRVGMQTRSNRKKISLKKSVEVKKPYLLYPVGIDIYCGLFLMGKEMNNEKGFQSYMSEYEDILNPGKMALTDFKTAVGNINVNLEKLVEKGHFLVSTPTEAHHSKVQQQNVAYDVENMFTYMAELEG